VGDDVVEPLGLERHLRQAEVAGAAVELALHHPLVEGSRLLPLEVVAQRARLVEERLGLLCVARLAGRHLRRARPLLAVVPPGLAALLAPLAIAPLAASAG